MSGPVVSREAAGPAFGRSGALEDDSAPRGPVSRCLCRDAVRTPGGSALREIHAIDRIPQDFECERLTSLWQQVLPNSGEKFSLRVTPE
jgi:hypothetical protein